MKRNRTTKQTSKIKRKRTTKQTPKRKRTSKRLRGGDKPSGSEPKCSLSINPINTMTTEKLMTDKDCVLLISIHGGIGPDLEKMESNGDMEEKLDSWDPTIDLGTLDISDDVIVNKLNIVGPHVSNFTAFSGEPREYAYELGKLMGFTCQGPYKGFKTWFKSNPTGAKANIKPKLKTMKELNLEEFKNQVKLLRRETLINNSSNEYNKQDEDLFTDMADGERDKYRELVVEFRKYVDQAESAYRIYEIKSNTKTINKYYFLGSNQVEKNRTTCCDYEMDIMMFDDKGNGTSIIDDMMDKGYSKAYFKSSTFKTTLEQIINYTHNVLGKTNIKMIDATCNNIKSYNYSEVDDDTIREKLMKQMEEIKTKSISFGGK